MTWMKDILLLERKFPVIFCLFQDIEDMSDIEIKYRFFDHILYEMNIFHNFFF